MWIQQLKTSEIISIASLIVGFAGWFVNGLWIARVSARARENEANRAKQLELLYNASCIASSGAERLVECQNSGSREDMVSTIAESLQKISIFIMETKRAGTEIHLNREDVQEILKFQSALIDVVLGLDPDAEDKGRQYAKMKALHENLSQNHGILRQYVARELHT